MNEHRLSEDKAVTAWEKRHADGWADYAEQLQALEKETSAIVKGLVAAIFKRVLQHEAQELQVTWRCLRDSNCATA